MSVDISAQQRQLLLNSGRSPELVAGPELQAIQQRSAVEGLQGQQRSLIGQFFEDPQRQQEINNQVQSRLDVSLGNIGRQSQEQERQARFAAAEKGNLGGSTIIDQNAQIMQNAQQNVLGATGAAEGQRFNLQQDLQNQQQQEIMNTFMRPQTFNAAEGGLLSSIGQQQLGVQQQQGFLDQQRTADQFANDEFSRAIGGTLSNIGNVFQQDQNRSQGNQMNTLLQELLGSQGGRPGVERLRGGGF